MVAGDGAAAALPVDVPAAHLAKVGLVPADPGRFGDVVEAGPEVQRHDRGEGQPPLAFQAVEKAIGGLCREILLGVLDRACTAALCYGHFEISLEFKNVDHRSTPLTCRLLI